MFILTRTNFKYKKKEEEGIKEWATSKSLTRCLNRGQGNSVQKLTMVICMPDVMSVVSNPGFKISNIKHVKSVIDRIVRKITINITTVWGKNIIFQPT